ncbi:hypothetical protein MTR_8g090005 [Medicago truncatula]|uniref:Uncharacterized protein n=1 Tax=Medicago truncatula TaxID=3880 RepID=A0A072TTN7_MEDTR|nr:hypothetical protein MTR_8g090005 [Medicago truncatula]
MNLVESGDGERWNQGYQIGMMMFFHGFSMKKTSTWVFLKRGCMQDYKLKQIKNGFLIRSVPLLFKEDDVDVSSISMGTNTNVCLISGLDVVFFLFALIDQLQSFIDSTNGQVVDIADRSHEDTNNFDLSHYMQSINDNNLKHKETNEEHSPAYDYFSPETPYDEHHSLYIEC